MRPSSAAARGRRGRTAKAALLLATVAVASGCVKASPPESSTMTKTPSSLSDAALARLDGKRILFGHQSVGANILDGIRDLERDDPRVRLGIDELAGTAPPRAGAITHFAVGKNGNPRLKTDHFAEVLRGGAGRSVDIALHKYCYVDFEPEGPAVAETFAHYRETMAALRREFPAAVLVHVTVPLLAPRPTLRERVGRLIGRTPREEAANVLRNEFNALLRKEYADKEPIFDLALVEATRGDGTRATFTVGGAAYDQLAEEYTTDGGHLNERGRRRVAEQLLLVLGGIAGRG